jgi:exodeoxyribonuclease VII small subunit
MASNKVASKNTKKSGSLDFEQSLAELSKLVEQMEQGDLSLEESLVAFEQGIKLVRCCQKKLAQAEQKVEILLNQEGKIEAAPFTEKAGGESN